MPESPEVQAFADTLGAIATGRVIRSIELEEFRVLKTRGRPISELVGRTVAGVRRYGKHVDVDAAGPHLVISFGRAGWGVWSEPGQDAEVPEGAAVVATIAFDDGAALALTDAGDWLSLGLSVVDHPTDVPVIARLGPDPLGPAFAREAFDRAVVGRRKQLKALLQEQESISGIGNAYSDEILHVARLSPVRHAASLTADERERLFQAVVTVLRDAAAARRGVPLDRQKAEKVAAMRVHGRTGQTCPVCGGEVRDIPGTKGGAQYCATCQTGGVPLA